MYSAPRAIQVAGAILAIATAGGVTSLPAAQSLSEYRPRVDQLARLWRSTSAAAARAESLQLRAVKLDTIRVAGLVVLTRSSYKQIVQEATGLAWVEIQAALRSDTTLLRNHRFYTQPDTVRAPTPPLRGNTHQFAFSKNSDAADVAARIVKSAGVAFQSEIFDTMMANWLPNFELRLSAPRAAEWGRIYIQIATATSRVGRECYIGDLEACQYALALAIADDPAVRLYGAEDRRRLVSQLVPRFPWELNRHPGFDLCVTGGLDAACLEVLRAGPHLVPPPLSPTARGTVLQLALEVGGDGAFGRLARSEAPNVELRLAEIAGVSPDSLLVLWRNRVLAARPKPTTLTRAAGWVAFVWAVALAMVATGSTRWRSG